jgi:hypothetical protein
LTWPNVLARLVAQHVLDQTELGECDAAICLAEEEALVRGGNAKQYTASLRADRARVNARMWITKAKIDMVTLFVTRDIAYAITLDPTI